jgi:2-polyprenyl-3-methyl-5-hydroxy-6-metoxy-1,4-benzoquinol methylase
MSLREYVLGTSAGFGLFKWLIASDRAMGVFADDYIGAHAGDQVLDVACGLGDMLDVLPDVSYVGVDMNADYIDVATRRRGRTGARFICASSDELARFGLEDFDVALLISAMHHLTDDQVTSVLRDIRAALKPGGRLVTVDPVWTPSQATTARVLIALDRGRHVRDVDGYARLLEKSFDDISFDLRHDLLRLPYTYCVSQSVRSA